MSCFEKRSQFDFEVGRRRRRRQRLLLCLASPLEVELARPPPDRRVPERREEQVGRADLTEQPNHLER